MYICTILFANRKKMSNEYFKFKQFTVFHDHCAMKVGTDGVLLGSWAEGGRKILDIGTGTGLIALMLSQRFNDSYIDAIEIDSDAVNQAKSNVDSTCFGKRINIFHSSIQDYADECTEQNIKYDCIVSNPPFFTEDTECPEAKRHAARHTDSLTYSELFECAAKLLDTKGLFSIIVPYEAKEKILFEACMANLFVKNICYVKTTPRKKIRRIMYTFSNVRDENVCEKECCLMNADGSKSEWYKNLTDDFYL